MIRVYADGALVYDSTLEDYELLGLTASVGLEKGGTAEIIMPPGHPAYNSFIGFRTIVEIQRAGKTVFRGRALYPSDDIDNIRTIICEGERCFLRDGVMQPYLYQADPAVIFSDVIARYNAQVDANKRFRVGAITARDPNNYTRIENEDASQCSEVIDKLLEYVGGYLIFTTDTDGQRVINWYESPVSVGKQAIEFGENLLDFAATGANEDFATVIYPYGAKNETTGERLTIADVNGGSLFVQDDEAVALRGYIAIPVYWDDVTDAGNLKAKALKELDVRKQIVTTLELTAVDLSAQDVKLDSLHLGDYIPVVSKPHGVDGLFLLNTRDYNFLDPSQDKIVLGKSLMTLTGADVASNRQTIIQVQRTGQSLKVDYGIALSDAANKGSGPGGQSGVSSVNGQTGAVNLSAADVGALAHSGTAADSAKLDGKTWAQVCSALYPVGSIYLSVDAANPSQRFGGTWEQIKDKFLLSAGDTYKAGSTGGEATHKLTVAEMPSHVHPTIYSPGGHGFSGGYWWEEGSGGTKEADDDITSDYVGGDKAHNNMPPYLTVYMWKRTA